MWDVKTGKLHTDLPGHQDEVFAVDWSPDGKKVSSGGKDKVSVPTIHLKTPSRQMLTVGNFRRCDYGNIKEFKRSNYDRCSSNTTAIIRRMKSDFFGVYLVLNSMGCTYSSIARIGKSRITTLVPFLQLKVLLNFWRLGHLPRPSVLHTS